MERVAKDGEKHGGGTESLDDGGRNARPEKFFGANGVPICSREIRKKKRQKDDDERIEMQRFSEMRVEQSGEGARGAAAGTIDVERDVDGAARIEVVPLGRKKAQQRGARQERGGGKMRDEARLRHVRQFARGGAWFR
jgi:hypothetical protein